MSARCESCGQFSRRLYDLWVKYPTPSIDGAVCESCAVKHGVKAPSR